MTTQTESAWIEEAMRLASSWMTAFLPDTRRRLEREFRAHLATRPAAPEGWVSVDDRLPEPLVDVLCHRRGMWGAPPPIVAAMYKGEWFVEHGDEPIACITHWRELPTPPIAAATGSTK